MSHPSADCLTRPATLASIAPAGGRRPSSQFQSVVSSQAIIFASAFRESPRRQRYAFKASPIDRGSP